MRPHETTKDIHVWRFHDIGIEVLFWRRNRQWGGKIRAGNHIRTLPMETLGLLIRSLSLETYAL